jgi:lipopolysaccharide/colanic/teichoic acid biosynthesis glycosyltransferase/glycosyltransferase involved in cell wall biosynthesis
MISIVVPAFNAAETVVDCISALTRQRCHGSDYEVILVDDASTDDTSSLAQDAGAVVIVQERQSGASAARNRGIQASRGEIVCFTDADCVPNVDWLSHLVRPFSDPDIVAAKGVYATSQTQVIARFVQIEYEDKYDLLRRQPRIDFVDTYSAAFRRPVLVANGGFDERIHYAEDRELAYRLASRGYQMVFQPAAVVKHLHSDSLYKYVNKKFYIGYYVAQTIRRYPGQSFKDSHTPQVMKIQILLSALFLASLVAAVFASGRFLNWRFLMPLGVLLLFIGTTIPFTVKALRKDRIVGLVSPFLLAVRALALGAGYTWGTLRPLPGISGENVSIGGLTYMSKRGTDMICGVLGLSLLVLMGPIIALLIRVGSAGPILVSSERIGQRGRPFVCHRFRILRGTGPEKTWIGSLLFRWRLHLLPLSWNLLKGDFSLVGPVAESADVVARYDDWHRRRLAVKPGLTGPVQLHPKSKKLSLDQRTELELDYIEEHTLWRDLRILTTALRMLVSNVQTD